MIDLESSSPRVEGGGVTALLAELLAEEEEKRLASQALAQVPPLPTDPQVAGVSAGSPVAGQAQVLGSENPALCAGAGRPGRPGLEGTSTPTSRQIAELSREMDACLSSLEGWEGESERRREALKRELESAYGFSYQDTTSEVFGCLTGHATADLEMSGMLGNATADLEVEDMPVDEAAGSRLQASSARMASQQPDRFEPDRGLLLREDPEVVRAEEERIGRLRREVEEMRRQACSDHGDHSPAMETPDVLQASFAATTGLTAWCAEVDAALAGEDLESSGLGGGSPTMGARGLRTMEGQLADAMKEVAGMEERLGQAQSQVNAELGDLDRLLAECSQVMGKVSSSAGSDA